MPADFAAGIPPHVAPVRVELRPERVMVIYEWHCPTSTALLRSWNVREIVIALTINHSLERAAKTEIERADQIARSAVCGVHTVDPIIHLA